MSDLPAPGRSGPDLPGQDLSGRDEPLVTVQLDSRAGRPVATLLGELDMSNADGVLARLVEVVDPKTGLDVELDGLAFIDSAGIGMLHRLNRHLLAAVPDRPQTLLRVYAAPDTVAGRTLRLAGMDQVLPMRDPGAA